MDSIILKLLSSEEPNLGSEKGQGLWQQAVILHCPKMLEEILYTAFMFMNESSWGLFSEILLYLKREYQKVVESDTAKPVYKGTKGRADKA